MSSFYVSFIKYYFSRLNGRIPFYSISPLFHSLSFFLFTRTYFSAKPPTIISLCIIIQDAQGVLYAHCYANVSFMYMCVCESLCMRVCVYACVCACAYMCMCVLSSYKLDFYYLHILYHIFLNLFFHSVIFDKIIFSALCNPRFHWLTPRKGS